MSSSDIQTSGLICSLLDCSPSLICPVSNMRIIAAVATVSYTLQSTVSIRDIGIIDIGIVSQNSITTFKLRQVDGFPVVAAVVYLLEVVVAAVLSLLGVVVALVSVLVVLVVVLNAGSAVHSYNGHVM